MPVVECDPDLARERLEAAGVVVGPGNTEHEEWRASHAGATAVAYEGKVVVQGADTARLAGLVRRGRGARSAPDGTGGERSEPRVGGRAHVYFDGACRGNPGPGAIGWVVVTGDGIVSDGGKRIGKTTNNRAEYEALLQALEVARDYGFDEVEVRGDSELVVRQVRGAWDTDDPDLRERRIRARELLSSFDEWTIEHVPRELNERADELANEALDDG